MRYSYVNSAMNKYIAAGLDEKEKKNSILAKLSNFISKVSSGRRFSELFEQKLKRAGMSLKGTEFIFIHITLVIISTLVTFLLTKNISLMLMIVMVVIFLPFLFINFKTGQRLKKFNVYCLYYPAKKFTVYPGCHIFKSLFFI